MAEEILKFTQKLGVEPSTKATLLGIQLKYWWYLSLILSIVAFALIIASLGAPVWVKQGEDSKEFKGALLYCSDGLNKIDGDYYSEILDNAICDDSAYDGLCEMVEDLRAAGAVYLAFSIITLACLLLWAIKALFLLLERAFLPRFITLSLPVATTLLYLIGFASWAGVSQVKYGGSCDDASDRHREDLCSGPGAALALFVILYLACSTVLFEVVYSFREGQVKYPSSSSQV
jgi:hypothetical protein